VTAGPADVPPTGSQPRGEAFPNILLSDEAGNVAAPQGKVKERPQLVEEGSDFAVQLHGVAAAVGELVHRRQRWRKLASGEHLIDGAAEVICHAGLHDIPAAPSSECLAYLIVGVDHAQEHDGHSRLRLLESLHGLKTVESRHVDVQDNRVGIQGANGVERLTPVGRRTDDVAFMCEQCRDPIKDSAVIIDEEDAWFCAVGPETRHRHGVRIDQIVAFRLYLLTGRAALQCRHIDHGPDPCPASRRRLNHNSAVHKIQAISHADQA